MMRGMARSPLLPCLLAALSACSGVSPDPAAMADEPLPARTLTDAERAERDRHLAAALSSQAAGRFETAEESARSALDLDPRSARARAVLGNCLLERARKVEPPDLALQNEGDGETLRAVRLEPADPVVGMLRARFLARAGHLSAAAAAAEDALGRAPQPAAPDAADPERAELLAAAAECRYELGEERAALPHLQALAALRPADAAVHYRLGVCRMAAAEDAAAMVAAAEAFARSAELQPGDQGARIAAGSAWVRAAELAGKAGDGPAQERSLAAAVAAFTAASERFPRAAAPQFGLGVALEAGSQPDAAAAAYRRALERDPELQAALLNLAALRAAGAAQDPAARAEAEGLLRRVLELDASGKARLPARERSRIEGFLQGDVPDGKGTRGPGRGCRS